MFEQTQLKTFLAKAFCRKCGACLDTAELVPISELPLGMVAHAVCARCQSENMVTITTLGTGVLPLVSDLMGKEIKKFVNSENISYDDVLNIHKKLRKESLCNLLHKKETNLVKK